MVAFLQRIIFSQSPGFPLGDPTIRNQRSVKRQFILSLNIPLMNLLAGNIEFQTGNFLRRDGLILQSLDSPIELLGENRYDGFRLEVRHEGRAEESGGQGNLAVGDVFLGCTVASG